MLTSSQFFFKDSFSLPTLLAIGALVQAVISVLLPARYALLPLLLLLGHAIITAILESTNPKRNSFAADIIPGRVTAQLPSATTGLYGSKPASEPFVVFHLGVRFSHPLGMLSPGAKEIGQYFLSMTEALNTRTGEFGMLGSSTWRANERAANNTMLTVFYFRDVEGLNRFAHDPVHRAAWDWYRNFAKKGGHTHLGVFHETFTTRPGGYETVYVNMPPVMMGAANVRVKGVEGQKEGEEAYARPLISADSKVLRSQKSRMRNELAHELSDSE